uniref:Serine hydroxymethyltransferase-like domain-containing protein n=1 Tax=Nelumbo nucifera TaxID=4432 RepID=A0A822XIS9_NELNU|nr:TPA_asm: hypothetical protein HUJ06_020494 [Nelumbo nucifera]
MVLLDGQVPMHYMVASLVIVPLSVRLSSSRITGVKAQVGRIESIASCHVLYDYEDKINQVVFQGLQGGPHNHTIAGLAATTPEYKTYQEQVLRNCSKLRSLVEKGYELVSGGTENHLVLVNLKNKHKMRMHEHHRTSVLQGIDVSRVEKVLELVHIAANKNTVLGDVSAIVLGSNRMDKVPFLN